jgi:oligopeptidase B
MTKDIKPPIAKKIPVEIINHGDKRIDNYAWLKDKSNPEVIKYLEDENRYTESFMADTAGLQEKLYNEMIGRIKEDDTSCPYRRGDYLYYYKEEKGKSYKIHFRKKADGSSGEEMILDENEIAKDLEYCGIEIAPSPDNKILAYMVDAKGDFSHTAYFKNLETGVLLKDVLNNVWFGEWSNDSKCVYYIIYEQGNKGKQVFIHTLGQEQKEDKLIYREKDEKFWTWIRKTASKKYIIMQTGSFTTCEEYYMLADGADITPKLIQKREENIKYEAEHNGEYFYLHTNFGAVNYRVMKTSVSSVSRDNWTEFIPEKEGIKIEQVQMFKNYCVIVERDYGLRKIKVLDLRNSQPHYIDFPEPIYTVYLQDNYEYDTEYLRYIYMSLTSPRSYYDHDMGKNENILLKQQEVLGGYNKEDYVSERLFAPSHDGKLIPISLVYRKGLEKNGSNPLFLHSYGAYGISSEIWFSSIRLSLLDRGLIFAIAHIRGGGELGEDWYNDGKLMNKKNVFRDFISSSEFLIEKGYTYKGGIAASGTSAGGTLMGAVVNMRPDLFKCITAHVPAVDILNNLFDSSVDNAAIHYGELGNPNIKEQYDYIKSYSPYENIKEQKYPALLMTTGLNDANVPFWEPLKYTAKLREINGEKNLVLLKTRLESAHFGPSGKYAMFREAAYDDAFMFKCFGIKE